MSDKTINELTELTDVSQTDELVIYDSSETEGNPTKKVKVQNLLKDVYSTDEVKTNKVWIDGKPIYKKTLTGNVTANVTSEIDIATLNIADLPNVEGAVKTGENIIPFGYGTSSADKVICFYNSTTGKFSVQSAYAGSFYVTIEYTKTTD